MTTLSIAKKVARAVEIDRQIHELTSELSDLKQQLVAAAEASPEEAQPTDGGGTSVLFESTDGAIARVTFAGRTLKSSVKAEGKDIEKIRAVAGTAFPRLFETTLAYKPVANFRDQAAAELGRDSAKLIRLVENPGKSSVSFETKERATA